MGNPDPCRFSPGNQRLLWESGAGGGLGLMKSRSHLGMACWLFLLLIRAWIRPGLGSSSFSPRDRGCQKYSH